jgi:hypothetical protein
MDTPTLINIALFVLAAGMAVLGWLFRELWGAVRFLRLDVQKMQIDMPTTYVTKDDWKSDLREISQKLDRISDKIDGKADKP